MLNKPIINLARPVKALSPADSAARAAGLLRAGGVSALPVVDNGRVIGVVSEASVLRAIAEAVREGQAASASEVPIAGAIHSQVAFAHRDMTIGQVADVFSSSDEDALPIVDDFGGFYGVVTRSDVLGFLAGSLRPSNVAGMATPLGVYLTNGSVRAGAGNLGLFLSGVMLGLCMLAAIVVVWCLAVGIESFTHIPARALLEGRAPVANWFYAAQWLPPVLIIVLIMTAIRLSPLSGYHAAEHMTVHAIEVGEELTPEIVSEMPRVHARCGTNLLAGASVFLVITGSFSSDVAVLIAFMVVILGWRAVGGYIQRVATTKPPSSRQLENGLRAGKELIARFQEQPNYQAYGLARVWNTGILQSMGGLAFVFAVSNLLSRIFHFTPLLLGV
ncbi:MAG: DUF1385 domain-containing protein [Armatimonadota bacterium]|nr:DUF1385 domain-containing protein [Armatimonadota bacterium]